MTDLASSYDPKSFESRLYAQWEAAGYFKPSGKGEPYTVLLPPPNVTGTLHMGHAFQHTLMDALVRYHRMRGYDTLWQMGTDHAGIATEMVVSRNLALEGQGETRDSLGRDGFIAKVWEWKAQSGDTIERQMRRMGASGDWSRSTFTMDEQASRAVIEAFVRWHEQGLIYRGQRLVNWDPVLKTAISDLEVENVEQEGFLWSIAYPLSDGSGTLTVATQRVTGFTLAFQCEVARHHHLGGDAGVVGAHLPQRAVTAHAVVADQRVLQRVLERVAHMQRTGDVRRRQQDGVRRAVAAWREDTRRLPLCIEARFKGAGIVGGCEGVGHGIGCNCMCFLPPAGEGAEGG